MRYCVATIILLLPVVLFGQASENAANQEMRLNLSDDGKRYLKWTFLNQVWLRANDSNPGTTVRGNPEDETFDIGLRRTRVQFFGQLTEHVFFYTQFGQNNFNYLAGQNASNTGNRKFQVFFHDALTEFNVWKDNNHLKLGAGLTITNGLSRFSQPSIGTILTMDVPVFAQSTVDQTDEFSRKLSVYARGQVGPIDYRLVLSDPFPVTSNGNPPPPLSADANFAQQGHHKQVQGFFIYNFFDSEPHTTPYMAGTYLGERKVLNLEAGFIGQPEATWSSPDGGNTISYHDMNLWSAAIFYDSPLSGTGTAVNGYLGYFNLDYGPNYLRYNGIMNPADGIINGPAPGSQGNAFPMFGTGIVWYGQAGFLLKRDLLGPMGTLQPYASIMSADYEKLLDPMNVWAIGVNWLLQGQRVKFSLDYQNRPVYVSSGDQLDLDTRKGQLVMQFQISI